MNIDLLTPINRHIGDTFLRIRVWKVIAPLVVFMNCKREVLKWQKNSSTGMSMSEAVRYTGIKAVAQEWRRENIFKNCIENLTEAVKVTWRDTTPLSRVVWYFCVIAR